MFEFWTKPPRTSPVGSYRLAVISLPEECDWEKYLPLEISYIFKRHPAYKARIRQILAQGKAIGVRTVTRTPENILKAIHTVSVHSQYNYIVTWLPQLLRDQVKPHFTPADHQRAKEHGEDLEAAITTITRDRLRFKRLVLIDEENIGISADEQTFMTELSELIYPWAIDYSVYRVTADNARERTKIAQTIIKALLIVGPVAHVLEEYARGVGKLFAASADDLLGESAELMALRGSGFTWRELAKRARLLIPVFALATWGALSVEGLLSAGHLVWGGVVFGFSAVALSLTTAVQSIFMYRKNINRLVAEKKYQVTPQRSLLQMAFIQDFTNPARLGLIMGALLAPIMGIIGSLAGVMHNGWALATIGSTESIVAGLTIIFSDYINEWRFHRKLRQSIAVA